MNLYKDGLTGYIHRLMWIYLFIDDHLAHIIGFTLFDDGNSTGGLQALQLIVRAVFDVVE